MFFLANILHSTRNMATHMNKCNVTVLTSKTWRWPSVAETCREWLININRTELHCDGIVYNIFNSMNLSPSRKAASCAATQELPSILCNPKVHYRVHNSPPLVSILNQIDPVHTIPSCLSKVHFNIVITPMSWSFYGLFLSGVYTNILYTFIFSPLGLHAPPISSFLSWSF
jgi:hypothetical protein